MPLITVLDSGVGNAVNYGDYPINVDSTVSLSTLAVRLVGAAGVFRGRGFFRENLEVDIIAHGRVPRVRPGLLRRRFMPGRTHYQHGRHAAPDQWKI